MKPSDSAIYSDNHLLVLDKPAGVATQPDFTDIAKAFVKTQYHKPGDVFLHPIHRLDKPVSGLVLFARTSKALSRLQEQMRERKIEKSYLAWVEGNLPQAEGRLVHFLEHGSFQAYVSASGKEAILDYKIVEQKSGLSLVEIRLVTGRYHQIRAQFSAVGCPIVGDEKYGSRRPWSTWSTGIALHHARMRLTHPVTKEILTLESSLSFCKKSAGFSVSF